MDPQMRFDGKVAIVTGSGNGLGRVYALDLARRGARVVVNDLGVSARGEGADHAAADAVVAQIRQEGGQAVANYDSVAQGAKIVQTALDTWGRVDILINNAGILRDVSFLKMSEKDWQMMFAVHLDGAFQLTKAAWPHMRQQQFGRILMVTSGAGLYGNFGQAHYSAMKMGLVGLANSLALEGAKQNILVNTIAPIAGSRMTETVMTPELVSALKPEYVSPLVLYLSHDSNKETGHIYEVGAGWVARVRYERSAGVFFPLNTFKMEDVAKHIHEVSDFSQDPTHPTSPRDAFPSLLANIERSKGAIQMNTDPAATAPPAKPKVDVAAVLAHKFEPLTYTYTDRDVMLYALGIGACSDPLDQSELKFVFEGHSSFQVFPTFGVVVPAACMVQLTQLPGLDFNPMAAVHGEQRTEFRKTIPTSGTLISYPHISALIDKGKGALLVLDVSTKDEKGEEVVWNQYSVFIKGMGNFGAQNNVQTASNSSSNAAAASPAASESLSPPTTCPPTVVHRERTLDNQALLYRLSGDNNPLHADPEIAQAAQFSAPILHGLCTLGYASRAVLKHCGGNNAHRMKSLRARFVNPVYPGETLVTEMWQMEQESGSNIQRVLFRTRVAERGVYVIENACMELLPEEKTGADASADSTAVAARASASPSTAAASSSAPSTASDSPLFQSAAVFSSLSSRASPDLVRQVNAIFRFDLLHGDGHSTQSWLLDLKHGSGSMATGAQLEGQKADCTIAMKDEDFVKLMQGKINPQQAFMQGSIKLKGNMMAATKLQLLQPAKAKL